MKNITIQIDEEKLSKILNTEMEDELLKLSGSKYWKAVQKYILARIEMVDEVLRSVDPINNAYNLALHQGIRSGLLDLNAAIQYLKDKQRELEKTSKEQM